ncbi:hypothetical protein [Thermococcus sp.]
MKFINSIPVIYYELNVSPERVRLAFPSAIEFKNPTTESFSIIQPPGKNAGLLVIDIKTENRYVFVLQLRDELILINETLPRVFVIPKRGFEEFFKALADDDIDRLVDKGIRRKGKKWRFLIDFLVTLIVVSLGDYFHLGIWGAAILGAVFTTVEYLFGPKKGKVRFMITELNEKTVQRMYSASEKKGKVMKISL